MVLAQRTISGTVSDGNTNEPLVGVNIQAKGTSIGAVTDINGKYTLAISEEVTVIVFSYIGYLNKEENIGGRTEISVLLDENISLFEEVVVIGYGQQQKKDLTTAVSILSANEIKNVPVNSIDQILTGKLAGVLVQQTSGSPGAGLSVRVRGVGSITAGNDPLYVIDGVPISNDNNRGLGANNP